MKKVKIATFSELEDRQPVHALVAGVDLVIIRNVSVLYGRCLHRGALLADGHIEGQNLICDVHNWDYRYDTGVRVAHTMATFRCYMADVCTGAHCSQMVTLKGRTLFATFITGITGMIRRQ